MPDKPEDSPAKHHVFPPWLFQAVQLGTIVVMIALFIAKGNSDNRSTSEEVARLRSDIAKLSNEVKDLGTRIPNAEVYNMKLDSLRESIAQFRSELDVARMMHQKLREDLLKEGVIQ